MEILQRSTSTSISYHILLEITRHNHPHPHGPWPHLRHHEGPHHLHVAQLRLWAQVLSGSLHGHLHEDHTWCRDDLPEYIPILVVCHGDPVDFMAYMPALYFMGKTTMVSGEYPLDVLVLWKQKPPTGDDPPSGWHGRLSIVDLYKQMALSKHLLG